MTATHRKTTRIARLRVVLYSRVSSDRHGKGTSVAGQRAGHHETARREDWNVVADLADEDVGASEYTRKQREEWPRALELIVSGAVDMLVVRALSRATRDRPVYAALVTACVAHGVLLWVGGKVYDPRDPDDAFALDIEAAFAVRGAGTISKDTRDGKAKAAARGRPAGRATWLHQRIYDAHGVLTRVELHEDRAAALREAAAFVLAGGSLTQAAKNVNALDLGREFSRLTLRKVLMSPTTAGLRELNGVIVGPAMWPSAYAVGDDDGAATHRELVNLLSEPDRRVTSSGVLQHLTPGIVLCGHPDHGPLTNRARPVMIGTGPKSRARLECSGGEDDDPRHYTSILRAPVDEFVWAVLVGRMARGDALKLWARARTATTTPMVGATTRELEQQLAEWEAAAIAGTLTPEAFGRIEAGLRGKIEKARADEAARTAEVPAVLRDLMASDDVPAAMEDLPIAQRRELLQIIGVPAVLPGRGTVDERVKFPWDLDE